MKLCSALLLFLLVGCSVERQGVVRHYIFGLGVVTVHRTNTLAQVVSTKALGVYVSEAPGAKFTVGYVDQISTAIRTNSNVIIEVK